MGVQSAFWYGVYQQVSVQPSCLSPCPQHGTSLNPIAYWGVFRVQGYTCTCGVHIRRTCNLKECTTLLKVWPCSTDDVTASTLCTSSDRHPDVYKQQLTSWEAKYQMYVRGQLEMCCTQKPSDTLFSFKVDREHEPGGLQESVRWGSLCIHGHPFTPNSDQCQISPAASSEILHHTVWRTWLFIACSDERWWYYLFSLHHLAFLFKRLGECTFWTWEWNSKLTVSHSNQFFSC